MMRTVRELSQLDGRVFVYLRDRETALRFLREAEREGFTFGDGAKPTEREPDDIYALHPDGTLNYTGFVGHMAFRSADTIGGEVLVKVDYQLIPSFSFRPS